MALAFNFKPTATLRARVPAKSEMISVAGITTANTTPANAAEQVNKLLAIAGLSVVADPTMYRTQTEEVVDNGN